MKFYHFEKKFNFVEKCQIESKVFRKVFRKVFQFDKKNQFFYKKMFQLYWKKANFTFLAIFLVNTKLSSKPICQSLTFQGQLLINFFLYRMLKEYFWTLFLFEHTKSCSTNYYFLKEIIKKKVKKITYFVKIIKLNVLDTFFYYFVLVHLILNGKKLNINLKNQTTKNNKRFWINGI